MSCNHPLYAFDTGLLTDKGRPMYFITKGQSSLVDASFVEKSLHVRPLRVRFLNGHSYCYEPIQIPCGSCSGCRLERAKEWKVRCCLEASGFAQNAFITLTYDNEHVPGDGYLRKKDLQDFFKRLRYYFGKLRYFACGEYGEITKRPHYHALLFGVEFDDCTFYKLVNGRPFFTSDKLTKSWPFGLALVGRVDSGSIAYVTGYVEKKQVHRDWFKYPVPPFSVMSRRPGIGSAYYDIYKNGFSGSPFCYGNFGNTQKFKLPRFFLRKLENDFPDVFLMLKERRKARAVVASDIEYCETLGATDDQKGFVRDVLDVTSLRRINKL